MLDDDNRQALLLEDTQRPSHVGDRGGVQVRGRLVGQEYRRAGGERAGERDLLELPARQGRELAIHEVSDPHERGRPVALFA